MRLVPEVCPYCERLSKGGNTHRRCFKKYGLDGLTSIWKYGGVIKKAIGSVKFKRATVAAGEIADLFTERLEKANLPNGFVLVPIPLFWYRLNERGFNQSEVIGKLLAKNLGCQFEPNLLRKVKSTASQVELGLKERKSNLKGSYWVNPNLPSSFKNVLLFDDVFTTGSTLQEACKTLKSAGVKKVWGLTLAR
jgi:ComF family protein